MIRPSKEPRVKVIVCVAFALTVSSITLPASALDGGFCGIGCHATGAGSCVRDGWEQGLPVRNECPATSRPDAALRADSSVEQAKYVLRNALKIRPSNCSGSTSALAAGTSRLDIAQDTSATSACPPILTRWTSGAGMKCSSTVVGLTWMHGTIIRASGAS